MVSRQFNEVNIAVFGSAFNPPTEGHKDAIKSILGISPSFDKILLVPSYRHAFDKQMLDYSHRLNMLKPFTAEIAEPKVIITDIEKDLARHDEPVYTFDLLEHLNQNIYPGANLTFVIGPDNQKNWHKFYRSAEISQRWNLLVVPQRKPVRSTTVREALMHDQPIDEMVCAGVKDYILQHQLYS